MIFGTQLCKWILITLVNLLRCVLCTSVTWWRNVDVTEITPFTVHVTLSPCCREMPRVYPSRDVAIQFARSESGGLQHLGYPSTVSTVCGSMTWMSWKNVCWGSGGCWTTPSSRQRLRSGVVVWMHVLIAWMVEILNINFEPLTFCCVLFVSWILVPLNV